MKNIEVPDEIIFGCVNNNRTSQNKLYNLLAPKMMSHIRKYIDDYSVAEEILNKGFFKVFKSIDTFRFDGSFEGWVYKIMYRTLCDHIRSTKKYHKTIIMDEKDGIVTSNAENKLQFDYLMKIVFELPEKHKNVFMMFVIEGKKHEEISNLLEFSVSNSKWYLFEARRILKNKIKNNLEYS